MQNKKKLIITFQDVFLFLTRFIKHWKIAALLFVLGVAASLIYYTYGRPTYYSRSLVAFDNINLPVKSETSDGGDGRGRWGQVSNILVSALNSRWVTEHTAQALGLIATPGQYEYIRDQFVNSVRVSLVPGNILQIEVYAYQPELVRKWPEAMIKTYKEYTQKQRQRFRDNAVEEYTKELARLKEKITEEQNASAKFEEDNLLIEKYIAGNGLEAVPGQILTIKNRLDSMDKVLGMVEGGKLPAVDQLSVLKKFRGTPVAVGTIMRNSRPDTLVAVNTPVSPSATAAMTSDTPASLTPAMGPGVGPAAAMMMAMSQSRVVTPSMVEELEPWENSERQLRLVRQEREQAALTYLPGHDVMRKLDAKILDLENSIASELNTAITSFKLQKDQMQVEMEELQKKMPDYRRVLNEFDTYKREFGLLTSGKLTFEQAYSDLNGRLAAMDYTGIDVRVEFEFQGFTYLRDDIPVSPNKQKLLLYGLMLGVGCAAGGCFGLEKLRSTTSLVTETEKLTGLNAIGVVPLLANSSQVETLAINEHGLANADVNIGETFRIIRSSIPLYVPGENKCQVIMVTSSRPSEGKTMVSSLLARSFADADQKTLLIDGDMRRGRVHRVFDMEPGVGLSGFLAGEVSKLTDAVIKTDSPKLEVLARGKNSAPRFEILSASLFVNTINELRKEYDRIIIDTPPLLGLADSIMVSKCVDGAIFVIRAEQTTQRDISTAMEVLVGTRTPIYGFVLNGVDLSRMENYYYYSSYYPKYYDPSYVLQHADA
ncbi:MAG: polysaccharide biosynthesis tyrosine autokinase [Verrucomicrobiota bacterium]